MKKIETRQIGAGDWLGVVSQLTNLTVAVTNLTVAVNELIVAQSPKKEEPEKEEWPKKGDEFFFLNWMGEIGKIGWLPAAGEYGALEIGNCFRTREEALLHHDRLARLARYPELGQMIDDFGERK